MSQYCEVGSGGLVVCEELKTLLEQPDQIRLPKGEQRTRDLYVAASKNFDAKLLHPFAAACYWGILEDVIRAVELGFAPDLRGTETPFKFGYATLVVAGAQRVVVAPHGKQHIDTLKFLLHKGCPADVPDIAGYTALHHATMRSFQPELARVLLEKGANVNHVNVYGEVPIFGTFHSEVTGAIELLIEFGADLDIPNWQGRTPAQTFVHCGPKVTAAITRALRKRRGEDAPMNEKKCDACGETNASLKQCSKCRIARYCSANCQKNHWPTHKRSCRPFSDENTVILKPFYRNIPGMILASPSDIVRTSHGMQLKPAPGRHERTSHIPTKFPKSAIIKVQVPLGVNGLAHNSTDDILIYTKKRDFVCVIRCQDNPSGYDQISRTVRTKGVGGAKAYFAAELKDKNTLIVKIGDVLAEQPF